MDRTKKTVILADADWRALAALARRTGSLARGGPNVGESSVWALMRRLARGELYVIPADNAHSSDE